MQNSNQIFVTGIERSGSTIIAKIISLCNIYTGKTTPMMENLQIKSLMDSYYKSIQVDPRGQYPLPALELMDMPEDWGIEINNRLKSEGFVKGTWMYKSSRIIQTWPLWYLDYPDAKWIFVRRRNPDIIASCEKTAYMKAFKNKDVLSTIKVNNETEGWLWWIRYHEQLMQNMLATVKIHYMEVWPERIAQGDYSQIYKMINWLGLEWNDKIIPTIEPLLWKSKNKK